MSSESYLNTAKKQLIDARTKVYETSDITIGRLVDAGLEIEHCIHLFATAHSRVEQTNIDASAHWIGQREVAYLSESQIKRGEKIGTDNLQQCVTVIIDGVAKDDKRQVAMAHIDRYTATNSIEDIFAQFKPGSPLKVNLYGAKDLGRFHNISKDNVEITKQIIDEVSKTYKMPITLEEKILDPGLASEIVYSPDPHNIGVGQITEGVSPMIGWETKPARLVARNAENQAKGHTQSPNINTTDRNSDLRIVHLDNPGNLNSQQQIEILNKYYSIAQLYADQFETKARGIKIPGDLDIDNSFAKFCATEFQPFAETIQKILQDHGKTVPLKAIYSDKVQVSKICKEVSQTLSSEVSQILDAPSTHHASAQRPGQASAPPTTTTSFVDNLREGSFGKTIPPPRPPQSQKVRDFLNRGNK